MALIAASDFGFTTPPFIFVTGKWVVPHWLQPLVVSNRRDLKSITLKRFGSQDWIPLDGVSQCSTNGSTQKQNIHFSSKNLTIFKTFCAPGEPYPLNIGWA